MDDTVLDIAAGSCEFINAITTAENISVHPRTRIAIDCNPDIVDYADEGVITYCQDAFGLSNISDDSVDVVFISNFFEHIPKETILSVLMECARVMKKGATLLILQPNFRYAYRNYWDFFDHVTPLTDRSLAEAISIACERFHIERMIPRFLPYTTKKHLPQAAWMVRLYLRFPPAWRILGRQLLCIVRKDSSNA